MDIKATDYWHLKQGLKYSVHLEILKAKKQCRCASQGAIKFQAFI